MVRISYRCVAIVFATGLALGLAPASFAEAPVVQDGPRSSYTGAFAAPRVEAGPTYKLPGSKQEGLGWSVGVGGRMATIVQIFDLDTMYRFHRYRVADETVNQHRLELDIRLHPWLMSHLGSTKRSYVRGGVHVLAGLGVSWNQLATGDSWSPLFQAGLGFDLPLTSPNKGAGWWLGVSWRAAFTWVETTGREYGVAHQLLLLSFEYRIHSLNFLNL
jgi:hypothetical protein